MPTALHRHPNLRGGCVHPLSGRADSRRRCRSGDRARSRNGRIAGVLVAIQITESRRYTSEVGCRTQTAGATDDACRIRKPPFAEEAAIARAHASYIKHPTRSGSARPVEPRVPFDEISVPCAAPNGAAPQAGVRRADLGAANRNKSLTVVWISRRLHQALPLRS